MKKKYLQPSEEMVKTELTTIICGSLGISSEKGISYGGVDEEGSLDPASRRQLWEDEYLEEEF